MVTVVETAESYRLLRDAGGRFAVVEARAGCVYSLHPHERREAPDTPEGMAHVVGPDGWQDRDAAERRFRQMAAGEQRYAERLR